jgi:hypothetical protein
LNAVSERLRLLLTDSRRQRQDVLDEIALTPMMVPDVVAALPTIERAAEPCGDRFVIAELTKLSVVFEPGAKADTKEFWKPYAKALADLPREAILGAVEDFCRLNEQHFPKPGHLRSLALRRAEPLYMALNRARSVINHKPRPHIARPDAAYRKAFVENFRASFAKGPG